MGRVFHRGIFRQITMPTQQLVNLDVDHYATVDKMDRLPLVINLNIDYYATVGNLIFLS